MIFLGGIQRAEASEKPFQVGEKLLFTAKWLFFDAGMVELSFPEIVQHDGAPCARFLLHTWTANAIAHIFKMDDRFESLWDMELGAPKKLTTTVRESHTYRDKLMEFDQEALKVTVAENKDPIKTFPIKPRTQDFFSASYATRTHEIIPKTTIKIPVFEDNKNYDALIHVIKKERIPVLDGKLDTVLIIGKVGFEGAFDNGRSVYIWLSDDESHIPVKVEMDFPFGNVRLELTKVEGVGIKLIRPPAN